MLECNKEVMSLFDSGRRGVTSEVTNEASLLPAWISYHMKLICCGIF